MSALERLLAGVLLSIALAGGAWLGLHHYGAARYDAGYAEAVALGKVQAEREAEHAHETETDLRDQLAIRDLTANKKDQEYATKLEAAQRRVRSGTDRLLCPASSIPASAAPGDRPAAGEPPADGEGPAIVPEVAAEILGDGAAVASLVSRYDQVVERFADCRAVNAK